MKFLDKFGLALFSVIILAIALINCVIIFEWADIDMLFNIENTLLLHETVKNVTLGVSIFLILLSIKCIFFNGYSKEDKENKEGILLENENGKLLISIETIENLTNKVVKSFNSAENVMTKVDCSNLENISIYITLFISQDVVIKELTAKLQIAIKDAIKKSLDLEIKQVNVRIKNITPKEEHEQVIIKEG